jgi:hypothetical protein
MARIITGTYIAGLVGAAALLAACGGGGSSPAPAAPKAATAHGTAAPSAANRTAVAHATLSLAVPKVVHAKSTTQALRPKAVSGSHTQFIDPSPNPNPSAGPAGNVLDIYVDDTLQPNLDGGTSGHSLVVTQTADGAQTFTLPIYSTNSNTIVAIELDPTGTQLLALGETDTGNFQPGTTQALSLTMLMNAAGIGVVDFPNQSNVQMLFPNGPASWTFACSGSTGLAFFPTDKLFNLLTVAGAGTGTGVTLTSATSINNGTSHLSGNSLNQYLPVFDGSLNSIDTFVSVQNPAYTIYADTGNTNYQGYAQHYFNGGPSPGPYQGIWDLSYALGLNSLINQTSTQSFNEEEFIQSGC